MSSRQAGRERGETYEEVKTDTQLLGNRLTGYYWVENKAHSSTKRHPRISGGVN